MKYSVFQLSMASKSFSPCQTVTSLATMQPGHIAPWSLALLDTVQRSISEGDLSGIRLSVRPSIHLSIDIFLLSHFLKDHWVNFFLNLVRIDLTRNGLSLRPSLKSRTNKDYFLFISYGNLMQQVFTINHVHLFVLDFYHIWLVNVYFDWQVASGQFSL